MRASYYLLLGALLGTIVSAGFFHGGIGPSPSILFRMGEAIASHPEGATWTAEDLREIAADYDHQADVVQAQAIEFERTAASITPLEDTKGFRRSALMVAAGMRWKEASELRQMAGHHRDEAIRLMGKAKSE